MPEILLLKEPVLAHDAKPLLAGTEAEWSINVAALALHGRVRRNSIVQGKRKRERHLQQD